MITGWYWALPAEHETRETALGRDGEVELHDAVLDIRIRQQRGTAPDLQRRLPEVFGHFVFGRIDHPARVIEPDFEGTGAVRTGRKDRYGHKQHGREHM